MSEVKLNLRAFKTKIHDLKTISNVILDLEKIPHPQSESYISQLTEILASDLDHLNHYFQNARKKPRTSPSKKKSTFDDAIQIDRFFASLMNEMIENLIGKNYLPSLNEMITGSELPSKITISSRNNLRNLMYLYGLANGLVDPSKKSLIRVDALFKRMDKGLKQVVKKVKISNHKLAQDVLDHMKNGMPEWIRFSDLQTILNVYTYPRSSESSKVIEILNDYKENGKNLRQLLQEEKRWINMARKKFK